MDTRAAATVLIVDDTPSNIDVLCGALERHYQLKIANNGARALAIAASESPPDLILLDVMMPDMDGFEVCQRLKANPKTARIPVIFVTSMGEIADEEAGFDLGAVDYVHKPVSPPLVRARVRNHLELYQHERHLDQLVRQRTQELELSRLEIIRRLGRAAEYKDDETGQHVIRMSHYARLLALAAGMSEHEAEILFNAAPMHDIGKIGIPESILTKAGKLDAAEWKVMKTHPQIGADIIGEHEHPLLRMARSVALSHHEKWDGSGYPQALKGQEIPLEGRIIAIADVFDALTSIRPYKQAWTVEAAFGLLREQAGRHFDPALVELFITLLPEIATIKRRHSEIEVGHLDAAGSMESLPGDYA